MLHQDIFWKLEALSDRQLLDGLSTVLASGRQALAQLLAHLAEVEERRLHLQAACSSLFSYCVTRLGLSEDEACRRIEVARLARRFPVLFPPLAAGRLSLSVAALLKPVLSAENAVDLIGALSGKSVRQARELLAARFPRPDVASRVRKLPEPRAPRQPPLTLETLDPVANRSSMPAPCTPGAAPPRAASQPLPEVPAAVPPVSLPPVSLPPVPARPPLQPRTLGSSMRIEPLSAARYRVQFTAAAELKRKLEMARDLMRHTHPNGDFEPILDRALDLLLAELMKRRFGATARPRATEEWPPRTQAPPPAPPHSPSPPPCAKTAPSALPPLNLSGPYTRPRPFAQTAPSEPATPSPQASATITKASEPAAPSGSSGACDSSPPTPGRSSHIARATRRRVLERDGLCCSWTDERGVRCGSRAWLEYDHRAPRGRGGGSELGNLRLLCRPHNRLAAEQAFGRRHIEAAIHARQQRSREP